MFTKVKAPESLTAKNLANNLLDVLEQLIRQVGTLNQFVRDCHNHYYSFSKEFYKHSTLFEGRIERSASYLTSTGV